MRIVTIILLFFSLPLLGQTWQSVDSGQSNPVLVDYIAHYSLSNAQASTAYLPDLDVITPFVTEGDFVHSGRYEKVDGVRADSELTWTMTANHPKSISFHLVYKGEDAELVALGDMSVCIESDSLCLNVLTYGNTAFTPVQYELSLGSLELDAEYFVTATFSPFGISSIILIDDSGLVKQSSENIDAYGANELTRIIVEPGANLVKDLYVFGSEIGVDRSLYLSGFNGQSIDPLEISEANISSDFTSLIIHDTLKITKEYRWFESLTENYPVRGCYWLQPFPLFEYDQSIADTAGRYVWFSGSGHFEPGNPTNWLGEGGIWMGFSEDPAVAPVDWTNILAERDSVDGNLYRQLETPWLVYNPDDTATPFYMYGHAKYVAGQQTLLWKSSNLYDWTYEGVALPTFAPTADSRDYNTNSHTGYAKVFRRGTGDWIAYSFYQNGRRGYWLSTDGINWSAQTSVGQTQFLADNLNVNWNTGTIAGGDWDNYFAFYTQKPYGYGKLFVGEKTPYVGEHGEKWFLKNKNLIAVAADQTFPGLESYRYVSCYYEDGILYVYARRGQTQEQYEGDESMNGELISPLFGREEIDLFIVLVDSEAAANMRVSMVNTISTAEGVRLSWANTFPDDVSFRIQRSDDNGATWRTAGGTTENYYVDKVVTQGESYDYRIMTFYEGQTTDTVQVSSTYLYKSILELGNNLVFPPEPSTGFGICVVAGQYYRWDGSNWIIF